MRAAGYRNGYGKPRRLSLSVGTITLRRPRVRGLAERFESQLLPLFKRRTETVGQLLPRLYLHGLALGDFDLALRGLLGDGAPLSAASMARLKAGWQAEYELWRTRSLADLEPVYPVGRRHLREGRAGEGQGRHARGPGRAARRPQGDPGRRERPPRVDGELARGPAGPQAPRACRRRASWSATAISGSGARCPRSSRRPPSSGAGTTGS